MNPSKVRRYSTGFVHSFAWMLFTILPIAGQVEAKLNVVATTPDLGAVAQAIGGDQIELTVLAKPPEDPHFVDPKPSFKAKLNRADVLLEGGADLEMGWLSPLIEGARNPRLGMGQPGRIACAQGLSLLEVPNTLDRSIGDIHALGNPHYMTDPTHGKIVAEKIAAAFCQLDPTSDNYFRNNLKAFTEKLEQKMAEWRQLLAPYRGQTVVTYHSYWIYFGRQFGLAMGIYLEPKPGIPPTPAHLAKVVAQMKANHYQLIIVQPYQNRRTAEMVAKHTGAIILDLPSFPGGSKETEGYIEWMDTLVKALVKGFNQAK